MQIPSLLPSVQLHHPAPSQGITRKLFHWLPDGSLQLRIDWSSIESFLGCNRLAEYKLVHSKAPGPKSALVFGAAMHAALEIWYRNKEKIGKFVFDVFKFDENNNKLVKDSLVLLNEANYYESLYEEVVELGPQVQLTREALLQRCYLAIESTFAEYPIGFINDYRTPEYCIQSFAEYLTYYQSEVVVPVTHQDKPLVEFSFSYPLGKIELPTSVFKDWGYGKLTNDQNMEEQTVASGVTSLDCSIEWTGIVDMIASLSGEHWLVDHKTTSILSGDFFDGFEIAMQPVGYVSAARAAFPELDIQGFMVNVLACRKPVSAVTASGKKSTAKAFEPHRRFYRYDEWKETEFRTDALALIEEFIANLTNNYFPRKTQWCIAKYGKCPFFEVCSLPPEQRMMMLESGTYQENTWKPV